MFIPLYSKRITVHIFDLRVRPASLHAIPNKLYPFFAFFFTVFSFSFLLHSSSRRIVFNKKEAHLLNAPHPLQYNRC